MAPLIARVLASIAAFFLVASCDGIFDDNARKLRFSGVVTSSITGQPIPDAAVSLERGAFVYQSGVKSDTTDQNGRYDIEYEANCEAGIDLYEAPGSFYLLKAMASGFQDQSNINIGIPIRCVSGVQTVNFHLSASVAAASR